MRLNPPISISPLNATNDPNGRPKRRRLNTLIVTVIHSNPNTSICCYRSTDLLWKQLFCSAKSRQPVYKKINLDRFTVENFVHDKSIFSGHVIHDHTSCLNFKCHKYMPLENQCKKILFFCDETTANYRNTQLNMRNHFALLLQKHLFLTLEIETGCIKVNNMTTEKICSVSRILFH